MTGKAIVTYEYEEKPGGRIRKTYLDGTLHFVHIWRCGQWIEIWR